MIKSYRGIYVYFDIIFAYKCIENNMPTHGVMSSLCNGHLSRCFSSPGSETEYIFGPIGCNKSDINVVINAFRIQIFIENRYIESQDGSTINSGDQRRVFVLRWFELKQSQNMMKIAVMIPLT